MVVSSCVAGPAGRMYPWDGAGPAFSTSSREPGPFGPDPRLPRPLEFAGRVASEGDPMGVHVVDGELS